MFNQCFPACQPCIPCPPVCPPKKEKPTCFFGKVEQKNINNQDANIYQFSDQSNFFFTKCGADSKKKQQPLAAQ